MGKILQTIVNGLTYFGDIRFIVVNYALLVLTLLPFLVPGGIKGKAWLLTLITVVIFQAFLWFNADAVGISVTWCAMAGCNFLIYRKRSIIRESIKRLLLLSIVFSVAGILYYGFTLPPVSTVAHTVAVLLGMLLFYLFRWLTKENKEI